ncbi:MAG: F0F1 ATP synthase subunit beta, partial [Erysipelotrichaceae bacterium]|nr:F0F1 ATP synthase subunit beta [Erysipelotrichaceae bacterium]
MGKTGKIIQVIGPVIDIRFDPDSLPTIHNAIKIEDEATGRSMVAEVAQHIGDDIVRCIAMSSTDGLVRGMDCEDTEGPIKVPVGDAVLGRMFNVLGEPIDGLGEVKAEKYMPIHRDAPTFAQQQTTSEILETGIKVIDLLCPYSKGGKIGLFGGAGVGKTVL